MKRNENVCVCCEQFVVMILMAMTIHRKSNLNVYTQFGNETHIHVQCVKYGTPFLVSCETLTQM